MDLADASLVLLAEELGSGRILSTGEREFRTYRWRAEIAQREMGQLDRPIEAPGGLLGEAVRAPGWSPSSLGRDLRAARAWRRAAPASLPRNVRPARGAPA